MFVARLGRAGDVHQFRCASQILLFVVHAPHRHIAGVLVQQVGREKGPAGHNRRGGFTNQLSESGEPDMLVGGESLEQLLPVCGKVAVGEEIGFAYALYLFPEVLIKHFLEAVLDDIVSGIEGNTTAFGLPTSYACHHLTLLLRFCAVGVSVHIGSCFHIGEAGCQDCLLFFKRTLGNAGSGLL